MRLSRAIALGGLTVGVLDILDAFVFYGLRGVSPVVILQSVASGALGNDSYRGGAGTAALGLLFHFLIALAIVAVYVLASRRSPALARRPFVWGPVYGVAVWLVMNFVVLPLSAAGGPQFSPAVVANGLAIHVFGVGLPSALFARAAR